LNSRFGWLREFAGKGLILLAGFAAKWQWQGEKRKNSRFHWKNREFC